MLLESPHVDRAVPLYLRERCESAIPGARLLGDRVELLKSEGGSGPFSDRSSRCAARPLRAAVGRSWSCVLHVTVHVLRYGLR